MSRARWRVSGALLPAIRYSRVEFPTEAPGCEVCRRKVVLTVGPFAIETYEPRQVRNEAAVSKIFYVPEDYLTRANCQSNAWNLLVEVGCTTKKSI